MRLLGPLLCPRPLPQGTGSLPSSVVETQKFIRESYTPSLQRDAPSSGYIFSLPLLGQLGFMLPCGILRQGMSIAWSASARRDQINLCDMRDNITQHPPLLLLVSGHSNQNQQHVTFGLTHPKGFFDPNSTFPMESLMFQLEPVQRVFYITSGQDNDYFIQFNMEGENPTLTCQFSEKGNCLTGDQSIMRLVVDSKGLGHFMIQARHFPQVNDYFHVDAMELIKCDFHHIVVNDYEYYYHRHEDEDEDENKDED